MRLAVFATNGLRGPEWEFLLNQALVNSHIDFVGLEVGYACLPGRGEPLSGWCQRHGFLFIEYTPDYINWPPIRYGQKANAMRDQQLVLESDWVVIISSNPRQPSLVHIINTARHAKKSILFVKCNE